MRSDIEEGSKEHYATEEARRKGRAIVYKTYSPIYLRVPSYWKSRASFRLAVLSGNAKKSNKNIIDWGWQQEIYVSCTGSDAVSLALF